MIAGHITPAILRPCPFWTWPLPLVGQFAFTTVQPHVRCLTLATVLEASRQRVCRCAPFDPASGIDGESLPWGSRSSSIHDEGWASHPPTSRQLSPSPGRCSLHPADAGFEANGSHDTPSGQYSGGKRARKSTSPAAYPTASEERPVVSHDDLRRVLRITAPTGDPAAAGLAAVGTMVTLSPRVFTLKR